MSNPDAPWLCSGCGEMMDRNSGAFGAATPKEGDLSVCINCGATYERQGERWLPASAATLASLHPRTRQEILLLQVARLATRGHGGGGGGSGGEGHA